MRRNLLKLIFRILSTMRYKRKNENFLNKISNTKEFIIKTLFSLLYLHGPLACVEN